MSLLRRWSSLLALTTALAVPGGASAATIPFGSNLSHAADRVDQNGQDTTLWPATLGPFSAVATAGVNPTPGVTVPSVPADGQVLEVTVRGRVGDPPAGQARYGSQPIAFQDLLPLGGGTVRVSSTSQPFPLPDRAGIYSYQPVNLCVHRGDFVGFHDDGGFDATRAPNGIPFEVLASVTSSSSRRFSKHKGTGNKAVLVPTTVAGSELLMQVQLGTGADASRLCPGGRQGPSARLDSPTGHVRAGTANVDLGCQNSYPCSGTLLLQGPLGSGARVHVSPGTTGRAAATRTLGQARFTVGAFKRKVVRVHLRRRARRLLHSHHRRLRVRLRVSVISGPLGTTLLRSITLRGA